MIIILNKLVLIFMMLTLFVCVCVSSGLCDFEIDLCYWVSGALSIHSVAWSWTSGASASGFAPQVDHTTNSNLGKRLCIDTCRITSTKSYTYTRDKTLKEVLKVYGLLMQC